MIYWLLSSIEIGNTDVIIFTFYFGYLICSESILFLKEWITNTFAIDLMSNSQFAKKSIIYLFGDWNFRRYPVLISDCSPWQQVIHRQHSIRITVMVRMWVASERARSPKVPNVLSICGGYCGPKNSAAAFNGNRRRWLRPSLPSGSMRNTAPQPPSLYAHVWCVSPSMSFYNQFSHSLWLTNPRGPLFLS